MKFRKKLDTVDAVQYEPGLEDAFGYRIDFGRGFGMIYDGLGRPVKPDPRRYTLVPVVLTLDEPIEIKPDDWIITSVDSHGRTVRSVCRATVFSALYEATP